MVKKIKPTEEEVKLAKIISATEEAEDYIPQGLKLFYANDSLVLVSNEAGELAYVKQHLNGDFSLSPLKVA